MRRLHSSLILTLLFIFFSHHAYAKVFFSKEEAFELAFGKDALIESIPVYLTEEQKATVEQKAQVKLDSELFTFFEGKKGDVVLGYAAIESHTVRTQPETLLILLSPNGELVRTEVLAFHEPPEYKPSEIWLAHLLHRSIEDLRMNKGVDAISGATLSSRATLNAVRTVLTVFSVVVSGGKN